MYWLLFGCNGCNRVRAGIRSLAAVDNSVLTYADVCGLYIRVCVCVCVYVCACVLGGCYYSAARVGASMRSEAAVSLPRPSWPHWWVPPHSTDARRASPPGIFPQTTY